MSIRRISKEQFDAYPTDIQPMAEIFATEVAWLANDDQQLIGTILLDRSDKDWNFVLMKPDNKGTYRWIAGNGGFESQDEAERELIAAMKKGGE